MKDKIEVFLSSRQKEFLVERQTLAKKISRHPVMVCAPLEFRGASIHSALQASLMAAKRAHIYVGIFGKEYSETTAKEYEEALKNHKPCLIYDEQVHGRDPRLRIFLEKKVKPEFKMHPFENSDELYDIVMKNLQEHIVELLLLGLQKYREDKEATLKLIESSRTKIPQWARLPIPALHRVELPEAESALKVGDLSSALIHVSITMTARLMYRISKVEGRISEEYKNKPLGFLIDKAISLGIIDKNEAQQLISIWHKRNEIVHMGRRPTSNEVKAAIDTVQILLKDN